jgi:hypothetical protein
MMVIVTIFHIEHELVVRTSLLLLLLMKMMKMMKMTMATTITVVIVTGSGAPCRQSEGFDPAGGRAGSRATQGDGRPRYCHWSCIGHRMTC